jgi:hypothetical protein
LGQREATWVRRGAQLLRRARNQAGRGNRPTAAQTAIPRVNRGCRPSETDLGPDLTIALRHSQTPALAFPPGQQNGRHGRLTKNESDSDERYRFGLSRSLGGRGNARTGAIARFFIRDGPPTTLTKGTRRILQTPSTAEPATVTGAFRAQRVQAYSCAPSRRRRPDSCTVLEIWPIPSEFAFSENQRPSATATSITSSDQAHSTLAADAQSFLQPAASKTETCSACPSPRRPVIERAEREPEVASELTDHIDDENLGRCRWAGRLCGCRGGRRARREQDDDPAADVLTA